MLKTGGGAIVNNSSVLGLKAVANMSPYVASKFAVCGLTRAVALDYAKRNIRVNAVAPGPIETPMLANVTGGNPQSYAKAVPTGRIGQAGEVAAAVVWLFSEEASFVTGHVLPVDGGWCA
jgi:NAD(P)-dependent dehydrogenase (short-subunit alcohol dehydrogenase family)